MASCICFVLANRLTLSASAIFIQSASPLYVLLLSPLILKERVARRDIVFMIPIAIGLALFFLEDERPIATAPDPLAGNMIVALPTALPLGTCWARQRLAHGGLRGGKA